jgi:hypothetical protein
LELSLCFTPVRDLDDMTPQFKIVSIQ